MEKKLAGALACALGSALIASETIHVVQINKGPNFAGPGVQPGQHPEYPELEGPFISPQVSEVTTSGVPSMNFISAQPQDFPGDIGPVIFKMNFVD